MRIRNKRITGKGLEIHGRQPDRPYRTIIRKRLNLIDEDSAYQA